MPLFLPLLLAAVVPTPEQAVFTCTIGDRTAVVAQRGRALVYRSLRRRKLELEILGGRSAREGFSGGGELQAIFGSGPWTYVVYERTVRTGFTGANDPDFEAGVAVLRGGRVVSRRRCDDGRSQFTQQLDDARKAPFIEH
jgi:hypothetical protein